MDENIGSALAKRLAAYSVTAGAALAAAPGAGAQVVYHDLDPDPTVTDTSLDIDGDGLIDLRLERGYTMDVGYAMRSYYYHREDLIVQPRGNAPVGIQAFQPLPDCSSCFAASRLSGGEAIGPDAGSAFPRSAYLARARISGGNVCHGAFCGEEGYVGFRFVGGDGLLHYGWLRLYASVGDAEVTVYEYAFEATPNIPIVAGEGNVILTGSLSDQVFPPEGGDFRYAFTLQNTTPDPLPLDLWMDAEHIVDGDVAETYTRRLGSGTLPAGTTLTRAERVTVPPSMPAGLYRVKFKVGDLSSGEYRAFQRFIMRKEGGASATGTPGVADEEASFFTVAPPEGNLFVQQAAPAAEASTVGAVGTHVLSAPTPNPASGAVALTLKVAESQAVLVEVYDAIGRRVATLHDGALAAGTAHRFVFDGTALPAGVYAVKVTGETFSDVRVVTLAR